MKHIPHYKSILFLLGIFLAACTTSPGDGVDLVKIDVGKSNPEKLLKFYFGGFVSEESADPIEAGLLLEKEGVFYLDKSQLPDDVRGLLDDADQNGTINWEELEPFLQDTYYRVRPAWQTLNELKNEAQFVEGEETWLKVEVDGVMTTARRHVWVERSAVRSALAGFKDNNQRLLYPTGTVFIGEHRDKDGYTLETTAMQKRADGFWDYFVYDSSGNLAAGTTTPPRALAVPTRCVGCHFGEKKFEPENSFPFPSTPGPNGPRGIYTQVSDVDASLVDLLDEHNRRSDTILGVYATIYLGELRAALKADASLDPQDQVILDHFKDGSF